MKTKSDPGAAPTVRQLLALVRASLWRTPADTSAFTSGPVNWDTIGTLAMLQTVGPLVVEGATRLPSDLRPPKEWLYKGLAMVERNRHTHLLLDDCVAETFSLLNGAGIRPVLLKGQAYARAYPDPTLRQCGDIDIYVGPDSYRAAYEAAREYGWGTDGKFSSKAKHYGCSLNGVKIELHRDAARLSSSRANKQFCQWGSGQLQSGHRFINIGGGEAALPTPMFDLVFVFAHMFHHFVSGGVGLRQVCDWTMLLHLHAAAIDRDELGRLLKDLRLLNAWRMFTPIAVDQLGLPLEECPFFSPEYRRKAAKAFSFIIREGNFGRGAGKGPKRPKFYLLRKAHSFFYYPSRLYAKFPLLPGTILRYHAGFIRTGAGAVHSDLKNLFSQS